MAHKTKDAGGHHHKHAHHDNDPANFRVKRSGGGTAIYAIAIVVKIISIVFSFLVVSDSTFFLTFLNWIPDYFDQSTTILFFSSVIMGLQVGILAYSLSHPDFQLGAKDKRPWLKATIFLFTPLMALFMFIQARMYNLVGWQMLVQVLLDILIFVGLIKQTGTKAANRLRPFARKRIHHHHHDSCHDVEAGREPSPQQQQPSPPLQQQYCGPNGYPTQSPARYGDQAAHVPDNYGPGNGIGRGQGRVETLELEADDAPQRP